MRLWKVNKHLFQQMKTAGELNHSKNKVCIFNKQDNFIIEALPGDMMEVAMWNSKSRQVFV